MMLTVSEITSEFRTVAIVEMTPKIFNTKCASMFTTLYLRTRLYTPSLSDPFTCRHNTATKIKFPTVATLTFEVRKQQISPVMIPGIISG
jgi:hypothetical protein